MKSKSVDKYTANDVLEYWGKAYYGYTGLQYSSPGFAGNDTRILKQLLFDYNIYSILLAIDAAIKDGQTSIRYFSERIENYVPSTVYSYFQYWLKNSTNKRAKELFTDLLVLEAKWFPESEDMRKRQEIEEQLNMIVKESQ